MNKKKEKKGRITGLVLIILIVVVIGGMGINTLISNAPISENAQKAQIGPRAPKNKIEEETVYTVLTQSIELSSIEDYLKFNGDVIAETTVEIYPDATGKLTKLNVSLGTYVRKGDIIAEVDPSLPGQKYVASPVKSTINGTITDLPYNVGATISSPQVPLATVGDLSSLQIQSFISEKDMASVALGQKALISFEPYENEFFEASITEISPVLDRNSRTLEIKLNLDKTDKRIKSGMFGSAYLITAKYTNALVIPSNSIQNSEDGKYVYVISQDMKAEMKIIETGLSIDGRTIVLSGISEGEQLVTLGQTMLQPGSAVKVNS
ncbi:MULTISPECIES: efflux RND transporter periplasmic adaptor subunit [unclassified Oceanispirochaeta]|uniref:efflux RND transporter periplasmic adaptor subunit n=1 Tax=unclassified Oceanispirochaeta TaxID=2635722 RepID=UPI000E0937D0|nr:MULTISPECIES: efflux RND transporter periplasmic adaptor subunit [unclassified Oceanispirochaeta]MBF9016982.1 efflux RND transporter periplasmic adaptor subunit [Oceanispirochaeta sp. M2]NPD73345.1 efflux RND transporter periplasmic adaptor subunit [Oceanispirochaeta sp. M1]RDG31004.1 efflux RND transporter periplasmic adaptor subunit [Oceanispirochaeta sp. M1]